MSTATAPSIHLHASDVARTQHAPGARRRKIGKILLSLLAIGISLAWIFPVYWMVLSAFTPNAWLRTTTPEFLPSTRRSRTSAPRCRVTASRTRSR